MCDVDVDWCLVVFVFVDFDELCYVFDVGLCVIGCDDFGEWLVFFYVYLYDCVEYVVWWQVVLVGLVFVQFG